MPVFFLMALWLLRPDPVGHVSKVSDSVGHVGNVPHGGRRRAWLWAVLLLADLWGLTRPMVEARPEGEPFRAPESIHYLVEHRSEGRVHDIEYADEGSPLGQG